MEKNLRCLKAQRNSLIASVIRMKLRLKNRGHVLGINEKLSLKERIIAQRVKLINVTKILRNETEKLFYVSYTKKDGVRKEMMPVYCRVA
jgi:hypothetical protein